MTQKLKIKKALLKELNAATKYILTQKGIAPGDLMNSIEWKPSENLEVMKLYALEYFIYQDTGRQPGKMPPIEAILKFIKRNYITPLPGQSYNQLAWAIAMAIKKNGFKGKHYTPIIIEMSIDTISNYIAEELSKQIADDIEKSVEGKLK